MQTQTLVKVLEYKRASNDHFSSLWNEATTLEDDNDFELSVPRTVKLQTHRANNPAESPMGYRRVNVYVPFLDHQPTELRDRICIPLPRMKADYLALSRLQKLTEQLWEDIKEVYWASPLKPHIG